MQHDLNMLFCTWDTHLFLINALEIAATHSTTYKLKYIILHCAVVIVIVDVNVVDVVVGIVDINVVVVVSMVQVPAPRRFKKKI